MVSVNSGTRLELSHDVWKKKKVSPKSVLSKLSLEMHNEKTKVGCTNVTSTEHTIYKKKPEQWIRTHLPWLHWENLQLHSLSTTLMGEAFENHSLQVCVRTGVSHVLWRTLGQDFRVLRLSFTRSCSDNTAHHKSSQGLPNRSTPQSKHLYLQTAQLY